MSKVVVVYHSGYGHTHRVAQFVSDGAGAELIAIDADGNLTDANWASLDAADAIIMGSPTYMGMASWQFKKFADATSKKWTASAWKDKVAGGFTCSASLSGNKLSTIQYFITLAMQQGMIWVGQPELSSATINRIGSNSASWRKSARKTRQVLFRRAIWTQQRPMASEWLEWLPSCAPN